MISKIIFDIKNLNFDTSKHDMYFLISENRSIFFFGIKKQELLDDALCDATFIFPSESCELVMPIRNYKGG